MLGPHVSAMMDVSDGLLIDAARMATASGLSVAIDLDCLPLSSAYRSVRGGGRESRITAATAGDDYELLFAAHPDIALPVPATQIGRFAAGKGLTLTAGAEPIALPDRLGFEHSSDHRLPSAPRRG